VLKDPLCDGGLECCWAGVLTVETTALVEALNLGVEPVLGSEYSCSEDESARLRESVTREAAGKWDAAEG